MLGTDERFIADAVRMFVESAEIEKSLVNHVDTHLSEEPLIVNIDDILDHSWSHVFIVRLETGTIWLSPPFIVAASDIQSALDEVADYCVEHGWKGYIEDDPVCEALGEHIPAGNGNTYLRDTGSLRCDPILRRKGHMSEWEVIA